MGMGIGIGIDIVLDILVQAQSSGRNSKITLHAKLTYAVL